MDEIQYLRDALAERDAANEKLRALVSQGISIERELRVIEARLRAALWGIAKSEPLIDGDAWRMRDIARKVLTEQKE